MICLAPPNLTGKEAEYTAQAISSGHVGPDGQFVDRFEAMVAKAAGRKWAVATITGTASLHVALIVTGVLNYECLRWFELSYPAVRNLYQLYGKKIISDPGGKGHDCILFYNTVADCAPAIGEAPTEALLDCYSFAANKIATCGQGGAVTGDDPILETRIRAEIYQGYGRSGRFNFRMANINAAVGCAQMERLGEFRASKRRIWERYRDAGLPMVERGASRWMSTIDAPSLLVGKLYDDGIEARAEPSGVSIPCGTGLTDDEQDKVIKACSAFA